MKSVYAFAASLGLIGTLAAAERPNWDVGIRDVYLAGLGQADVWSAARTIGVTRLEVLVDKRLTCPGLFEASGKPYRLDTPDSRRTLGKALADHGMSICALCADVRGKEGPQDGSVQWLTQVAEAASDLKVAVIMVPLCYGAKSDEDFIQQSIDFLRALAPLARKTGVRFAIENLGTYVNRREIVLPILKAVPADQVGLANDICNMYWFGYPISVLYELARDVAPSVRYVHVKSIKYPPDKRDTQRKPGWEYGRFAEPVRTGDIDFRRIIGIYAAAGFRGDLTIEDDSLGKFDAEGKTKVLLDDVKLLREIIQGIETGKP
jgi:sugar phosphate isomerase/epimerase